MGDLAAEAREWIAADPDPGTREELQRVLDSGDWVGLERAMASALAFGTAGIRGEVGPGPARMNRAVVIRTTWGLARYLVSEGLADRPVVVGFDARPSSRRFAEDTAGVLVAAGIEVRFFPEVTPTPLVAFAAKVLEAAAAVVVTASHNPPQDNGYKVYGPDAAQIVPPTDTRIEAAIAEAPPALEVPRVEGAFSGGSPRAEEVPADIRARYWEELSAQRRRDDGSRLVIVYTPIHGCGLDVVTEMMSRAGHTGLVAVPEQAEPDGTFPTVRFPNPEEPGALDLALGLGQEMGADLILANDPDADRLAVVVPHEGAWRQLSGNEVGWLLGDYLLATHPNPSQTLVVSSVVSSPMLGSIAAAHQAAHEVTLTGFKWIVRAGRALEESGGGEFIFGYEEALGYTVGPTVRDKDGISAAVIFTDLAADLADAGETVIGRLHRLWEEHGLWVSAQVSLPGNPEVMTAAVERLADHPPATLSGRTVTGVVDYRHGAERRPPWLGVQDLVELRLGEGGRVLVRPSGTEPKLKLYVDLTEPLQAPPDDHHRRLLAEAHQLGQDLGEVLGL